MSTLDILLKEMVIEAAEDFAAWLLREEIVAVEPLTVELPAESLMADTVFRVTLPDGRATILQIEFQGRRSRSPMPDRMLQYMARLAQQYGPPLKAVVFYVDWSTSGSCP
ncbi:MAG: hypothetical protein AB1791_17135 [Chloroflexota bacterium]